MNHRVDAPEQAIDFNNENSNTSANPTFDAVLDARLSRRGLLRGGVTRSLALDAHGKCLGAALLRMEIQR